MNNLIKILILMIIYHFLACSISSLIIGEAHYFDYYEWERAVRFMYLFGAVVFFLGMYDLVFEN